MGLFHGVYGSDMEEGDLDGGRGVGGMRGPITSSPSSVPSPPPAQVSQGSGISVRACRPGRARGVCTALRSHGVLE